MNQAEPGQLRDALQWALDTTTNPAVAAADWLASDIHPSCTSAVELFTSGRATIEQLRQAKDAYKTMRVLGETITDRRVGGQLYVAAIASALVNYKQRISRQSNAALSRALGELMEDEQVPPALRRLASEAREIVHESLDVLGVWLNNEGVQHADPDDTNDQPSLEIERTFLLNRLPELPPGAQAIWMEQGYLPSDAALHGRLRMERLLDGTVRYLHTIKQGQGLVRQEQEREMQADEFAQWWPLTAGRRLKKTRYKVPVGDLVWEIDAFDDLNLILAEVELPTADAGSTPPDWLEPCIVREVTDEKQYGNYELALRLANR